MKIELNAAQRARISSSLRRTAASLHARSLVAVDQAQAKEFTEEAGEYLLDAAYLEMPPEKQAPSQVTKDRDLNLEPNRAPGTSAMGDVAMVG